MLTHIAFPTKIHVEFCNSHIHIANIQMKSYLWSQCGQMHYLFENIAVLISEFTTIIYWFRKFIRVLFLLRIVAFRLNVTFYIISPRELTIVITSTWDDSCTDVSWEMYPVIRILFLSNKNIQLHYSLRNLNLKI